MIPHPHTLTEAYSALRMQRLQKWAETQRDLAAATGKQETIERVEKIVARRLERGR